MDGWAGAEKNANGYATDGWARTEKNANDYAMDGYERLTYYIDSQGERVLLATEEKRGRREIISFH